MLLKDLTPRQELLQIQKKIFARNNEVIRSQALIRERGFENYERCYKRYVRSYRQVSNIEELMEEILKADIVYLGDYHTNPQSQRMLLRLLKLLVEKTQSLAIGLELVQKRHQAVLEAYLQERIAEETFLKKIQFRKYWYFDLWRNFKPIFDFARYWKIPLFAVEESLSGDLSLGHRDERNAAIIASIVRRPPERKLVVFAGDLHLAPPHLPDRVLRLLPGKRDLILYQNSEAIYWKLAEEGREDKTEIVRLDERSFCLINTPPIVWQQSYLNWLEHEEGEIDYADAKHSFLELLKQIADFLEIPLRGEGQQTVDQPRRDVEGGTSPLVGEDVPKGQEGRMATRLAEDGESRRARVPVIDEVEVFTCGDLSFLKRLAEDGSFSHREIQGIKKQILSSESYCIPRKKYVYLANLSLNHAAEEAAHYLKYLCSGEEFEREAADAFYANVLHESLGFFGSKIINHKRKCFHEKEYQGMVNYLRSARMRKGRELELEMSLLILDHKRLEKRGVPIRSRRFFGSRPDLFFAVTHGLGYMLGDKLYYALLAGKVAKEEIRELFCDPMREEGKPFEIYTKLLHKVRKIKIPKRV